MEGLKSLNRSSDAILSYSEDTGTPIFSIDTSLMLSNLTFKSGAKGQVDSNYDNKHSMPTTNIQHILSSIVFRLVVLVLN